MNRRIIIALAATTALAACGQVKPGHVGLKVNQFGSGAGVAPQVLGVGTYFTPLGTHIEEFPVSTQNHTFTSNAHEQNATNEEFSFQDNSGVAITADLGINYHVEPSLVPQFYQRYRMEMDAFVNGPLRNEIRNELIDQAGAMTVQDIYGPRKAALLNAVEAKVRGYFAPYGFNVEKLFWVSAVRPPESIQAQITARIANENAALAAQAKVATIQAEAQQRIAQADGEAQAIQKQSEALRASPEYVQFIAVQKWDGHLPTYASSGPLPFIGKAGE